MITIILLFAVAAVFGIVLIIPVLQGKTPSKGLVFTHGGIAALALVMLLLRYFNEPGTVPQWSRHSFCGRCLRGFCPPCQPFAAKTTVPKPLALVHAAAAVVAFLILLFSCVQFVKFNLLEGRLGKHRLHPMLVHFPTAFVPFQSCYGYPGQRRWE